MLRNHIYASLLLIALNCSFSIAQSDIKLSNFYLTPMTYNPAYAGCYEGLSFTSFYSSQWVGFDGAPKTFILNGHGRFFNDQTGLGLEIINDQIGATSDSKILGNYSYHLELNYDWKLSMGIKAGMSSHRVDYGKLNIENPNEIYNSNEKTTWSNYNVGMGFYLYNEKYYFGLSIPNLLKNTYFDIYNNTQANSSPNYYFSTGYKFEIDRDIYLSPSILTRIVQGAPINTLFASTIDWEEKFYGSLNIDLNSTFGGFAGFRINEKYMIGYSYDTSINNFSNSNGGIHSFFLNIRLENNWSREKCGCYSF